MAVSSMFPGSFAQKLIWFTETNVGATGSGFTVTVTLAQSEVPQEFSQRA
jgi:hypothetical protein